MTIARAQMYRQLYQLGGSPTGIQTMPMDYGQSLQVPPQQQSMFTSTGSATSSPVLNYGQTEVGKAGGTPLVRTNYQEGGLSDFYKAEEPIIPRIENIGGLLDQAEKSVGQPTNNFNSPLANTFSRFGMKEGGITSLVEREKYGIGSKLKKFVRNIIPNEVAQVASVAAPFVAPFNPALGAAMAGLGNFDQTGRIGSSLGKAALTYGGGQLARYVGGAGVPTTGQEFLTSLNPFAGYNPQSGFMGLESLFTNPIGTQTGLKLGQFTDAGRSAINQMEPFGGSATTGTFSKAPGALDQLRTIFDPTSNVDFGTRAKAAMDLTGDAIKAMYTIPDGKGGTTIDKRMVISTLSAIPSYLDAKKKADEIGLSSNEFNEQVFNQEKEFFRQRYAGATPDVSYGITTPTGRLAQAAEGGLMDDTGGILSIKLTPAMAMGGRIDYETGGPTTPPKTLPMDLESLARRLFLTNLDNLSPSEKQYLYEFKEQNKNKKAKGGVMGSEIPVRQNQGGITELDLRAKGGYIPVGIKEKADDVPAMLSKNEFVFTADAVRGAGGGKINKGAQKMYKLMKSLEKKVKKIKKVA
jgi:hypothetical protein